MKKVTAQQVQHQEKFVPFFFAVKRVYISLLSDSWYERLEYFARNTLEIFWQRKENRKFTDFNIFD